MVGPVHERLIGDLRGLPLQPEVRAFESLHRGGEELQRFRPDVLLVQLGPRPAEDIGALRLLRNLWSDVGVVLVTDLAGEIETTALAQRVGAHRLVYPDRPGELAATIEQARHGADGGRGGAFHDLAHGMADEINNPLQSVSGQLQLLHADLDPTTQRARRDQVRAALEGVQRIQATVDRLRLVTGAANGPRHREPVDLASLLQAHLAARSERLENPAQVVIGDGGHVVEGDPEQLSPALREIVRFADAMSEAGIPTELVLEEEPATERLRIALHGEALGRWRLPNTFRPFYPSRLLQGHGHGLALFLAQTVMLGHGGQASARRLDDGLEIVFVLGR